MSEPTLAQVFGANATQNSSGITISKTDLAAFGLTASGTNTAESLAVALILQMANYLNETNQATNSDIQVTIAKSDFESLVTRNDANYRQVTFNVNLQTIDTTFIIDPDNY
ncbi:hypothetical protein NIES21_15290 [Anabaenopsis circularis NIES-21]|uniref:Uncharacterized protein n=1 Tax=Anabaenopsis circularis NIES-21 TaxID=1085406 RepID=A0A1Z4GDW7_9CYAN|nr:hypothetical protein NIES21_15290 [Anabaenopsis circularis NIES-21]